MWRTGARRILSRVRISLSAPASGSDAIEQSILKAIQDFTQGMPQTDDITFVVVEKCR